jgi:hypothetical protein
MNRPDRVRSPRLTLIWARDTFVHAFACETVSPFPMNPFDFRPDALLTDSEQPEEDSVETAARPTAAAVAGASW